MVTMARKKSSSDKRDTTQRWVQRMVKAALREAIEKGVDPHDKEAMQPLIEKHLGPAPKQILSDLTKDFIVEAIELVGKRNPKSAEKLIEAIERHDIPEFQRIVHEIVDEAEKIRMKTRRPSRCTKGQLAKVGVEITDASRGHFRCKSCGASWSPNLRAHGYMPRGYWKCPNGCNA
jgi:hypothetical protein